jgi:sulfite reductase subunit B
MCEACGCHEIDSIYLPKVATIIRTFSMTDKDKFFEFKLQNGEELGHKPGQFAEISIPGIGEAPISLSSSPTKATSFEMVIRKVGKVTNAIHNLKEGDFVGIRGPYGTSFPMEELKGRDLLFIAGGIGLVPLRSAINYALDKRNCYGNITILFGCVDPSQRLFVDELEKWSSSKDINFLETVDRCKEGEWKKNIGVITTLFPKIKNAVDPQKTTALVVGPPVMYKFVILELRTMGFKDKNIIVSLERRMKCGVGKCGHCQIDGIYVCQEGPVFTLEKINNLVEAF